MRFKGLDLNLLVALDALLTQKNISHAAESLHLSQSGMSGALARLREYFQDDLLVLMGRNLVLTPLAETLVNPVREVLLRIDATIVVRPEFDPLTDEGTYRLLVSELTMLLLMPPLVRRLAVEAPNVRLELLAQFDKPGEMLERGEADFLLIPSQFASEDHPSLVLYEERYDCVVSADNEKFGDTISFEDYLAAGHVAVQYGTSRTPAFDGWFLKHFGVARRTEVITSNLLFPPVLVVGTNRIATIHRRLAHMASSYLPVRILPPPVEIPVLQQVVQWHKHRSAEPGLLWLRGVLEEEAKKI